MAGRLGGYTTTKGWEGDCCLSKEVCLRYVLRSLKLGTWANSSKEAIVWEVDSCSLVQREMPIQRERVEGHEIFLYCRRVRNNLDGYLLLQFWSYACRASIRVTFNQSSLRSACKLPRVSFGFGVFRSTIRLFTLHQNAYQAYHQMHG